MVKKISDTQNYGSLKTTESDYSEVKKAIAEMAKTTGKTEAEIAEIFKEIEKDGVVNKEELEKKIYDLKGDGYDISDNAEWKKKMAASTATAGAGSSVLQDSLAILKKHGLAPSNANNTLISQYQGRLNAVFQQAFENAKSPLHGKAKDYPPLQEDGVVGPATRARIEAFKKIFSPDVNVTTKWGTGFTKELQEAIDKASGNAKTGAAAKSDPTATADKSNAELQTISIRGTQYANVKKVEYHPGTKTVKTLQFATPQTVTIGGKDYPQVGSISFSYGEGGPMESFPSEIKFSPPQRKDKYWHVSSGTTVSSYKFNSSGSVFEVKLASPQTIKIADKTEQKNVVSIRIIEDPECDGTSYDLSYSTPQKIKVGDTTYNNVKESGIFANGQIGGLVFATPQNVKVNGETKTNVRNVYFENGTTAHDYEPWPTT